MSTPSAQHQRLVRHRPPFAAAFLGAVGAHIRVKDTANVIVPAVILVFAVATLVLRAATA